MESVTLKKESLDNYEVSENEFSVTNNLLGRNLRSLQKCGEIFISEEDVFNFLCTLCEAPFEEVEKFLVHVKSTHKHTCYIENSDDPLKSYANQYEHGDIKFESDVEETSISESQQTQVDSPEKISIKCEESISEIFNQESSEDRVVSEESNNEIWANIRKNVQKRKTRKKFELSNLGQYKQEKLRLKTKKDFVCDICSGNFTTNRSLRRHLKNIHDVQVPLKQISSQLHSERFSIQRKLSDIRSSREEIQNDSLYPEKDLYKCKHCDRQFVEKTKLEEHETIYCGDKPCQCQTCGKQFKTKAHLWRHETIHTDTREHKCDTCQSTFKSKSGLYSHMLRHGEKKFSCSHCGKLFFLESEKREHERVHTGEKPYQCTFCGKCFQTSGSLSTHVKSHTGRRPHKCQYCDKSFYTKAMLNNHIVIHTGERPFICEICKATFPRKKALKSHEKIHSDLRGYVCKICGEAFKQYAGLYCHKKSHGQPIKKFNFIPNMKK